MNRKLISDALGLIDDACIEECIIRQNGDAVTPSERNLKMKYSQRSQKNTRRLIVLGIAACLVLSMAVTAGAANLWGIRDMFDRSGYQMPEEAYEYIQPQDASVQEEEWSCRVTESLCDNSSLTVAVTVTCPEKYVIVPTDASPGDSARGVIGVDSDLTLGEYAAAQNKELMYANASLGDNEEFDVVTGMLSFEYVSDSHAVLMTRADIEADAPVTHGCCTVYIDAGGRRSEKVLEFDLAEAPTADTAVFVPVDPNAVVGLSAGEAEVIRTPLGISVRMEETILDQEAFGCMEFVCVQFPGCIGGSVADGDGKWFLELNGGQGIIGDTLVIRVLHCATGETIGDIVFTRK